MDSWSVPIRDSQVPVIADGAGSDLVVVLGHGAGSNMDHKTMEWLAEAVRPSGARVVRFNFLYRALGKGMPDRMPLLIETYLAVVVSVREQLAPRRLIVGGHSMGGRVASMMEAEQRVGDGLLLFGYPLHPPQQPEKLRAAHLGDITTPTLQLSGTEDEFCTRDLMEAALDGRTSGSWNLHWIEGADHSYSVKRSSGRTRAEVHAEIQLAVTDWIASLA